MLLALLAWMESGRLGCWRFGRGSAGIGEREGVSRVRGTLHYCTEGVEAAGASPLALESGALMESSLRLGERFPGASSLGEVTTLVLEFSAGELTLVSLGRRQPASLDPPLWPVWVCWDWSECPWYHPSGIAN
jgi:hypothetical protein